MPSLADGLPPEVAKQIHPEWRQNEADYWVCRDQLIAQYRNRWIGFAGKKVVADGASPVQVLHDALQLTKHPFVILVGREDQPCKMRRATFAYDRTYSGEPLPQVVVEFRTGPAISGTVLDRVVPDTGADASALPWSDCQQLGLDLADGIPSVIGGIGDTAAASVSFLIWAHLDGQSHPCRLHADFSGQDRILGRDVLNRIEILFRGPTGETVVNP